MSIKDLSGKTVYDLEQEDFEKLFCWRCVEKEKCPKNVDRIEGCKFLIDSGLWYRCQEQRKETE